MTRGGARAGAGRKPLPTHEKRVKTSFALVPAALAKIDGRAKRRKCSRNDVVEKWALGIKEERTHERAG